MKLSNKAVTIAVTLKNRYGNGYNILSDNINDDTVWRLRHMPEYSESHYKTRENLDDYIYENFKQY